MKYRKKPVEIEAIQWMGFNKQIVVKEVHAFKPYDDEDNTPCPHCKKLFTTHGWIKTLEGGHIVCPGDWIITGVEGEKYPCKPDIFEKTYDKCMEYK